MWHNDSLRPLNAFWADAPASSTAQRQLAHTDGGMRQSHCQRPWVWQPLADRRAEVGLPAPADEQAAGAQRCQADGIAYIQLQGSHSHWPALADAVKNGIGAWT